MSGLLLNRIVVLTWSLVSEAFRTIKNQFVFRIRDNIFTWESWSVKFSCIFCDEWIFLLENSIFRLLWHSSYRKNIVQDVLELQLCYATFLSKQQFHLPNNMKITDKGATFLTAQDFSMRNVCSYCLIYEMNVTIEAASGEELNFHVKICF